MNWLIQFIDYKRISILAFEKKIGVRSTVQKAIKGNSNLGSNLLAKIVVEFPDINPDWLLTGKGEMLRNSEEKKTENPMAVELLDYKNKEIADLKKQLQECLEEKKVRTNSEIDL